MVFRLPENLLMGVSTAATQIEGGAVDGNWNDWYRQGKISDGTDPATGNDHWENWRQDTQLLQELGIRIYRFGVEWPRLLPEQGKPDEAAIARYRQELEALRNMGIRPLLTIHHFSNPMWFERKGGFTRRENLQDYLDLVQLVVERFGDLVSEYITINEPNVYAMNGFFSGTWPPGHRSLKEYCAVLEHMAFCHIKAYTMIHTMRKAMGHTDTMVGFANHVRCFDPKNPGNPWHRLCAKIVRWVFQGCITEAMSLGRFRLPLRNHWKLPEGEYSDFNGVNYYSRSAISGFADGVRENCAKTDLGWEIYPEGLVRCAGELQQVLQRPLWVTENGTCDNDDRFRSKYLRDHLEALSRSGLPFERYYHWCFCDNFEWVEGNSAKFGLVSVDPATKARTIKESGRFYAEIIKNHGVTKSMEERYVQGKEYDIR